MRRALFLDRDGVINVERGYAHAIEHITFIDGIFDLAAAAKKAGCLVVVVTNQSGIGRGYYTEADFHALTGWMRGQFEQHGGSLDAVYFCPDHPEHGIGPYKRQSAFRKPAPGMFLQAAAEHGIDLARSLLVGDSESDMEAGAAAGVGTLLCFGNPRLRGKYGCIEIRDLREASRYLNSEKISVGRKA